MVALVVALVVVVAAVGMAVVEPMGSQACGRVKTSTICRAFCYGFISLILAMLIFIIYFTREVIGHRPPSLELGGAAIAASPSLNFNS